MNATHSIRPATSMDAPRLAAFGRTAFRDTFADSSRPEDLARYLTETFSVSRVREEIEDPRCQHWVCDGPSGEVRGSVKLREGKVPCGVPGSTAVEIQRLYVAKTSIGTGLGFELMCVALRWAGQRGFASVWLGVWEHNERAISFYEGWGFVTVGQHIFQLGDDAQTDLIMARDVGVPPPKRGR